MSFKFIYALYSFIIAQAFPHVSCVRLDRSNFSVVWNVPTQRCLRDWNVSVDVSKFGIISNKKHGWRGEHITIFPHPGRYPRIASNGTLLFGGVPQNTNLSQHLESLRYIIRESIPKQQFSGLAVVDYEAWRPNWIRNWDKKEIYRALSKDLVKTEHPDWSKKDIETEAKRRFEKGARLFMESTLSVCKNLRPHGQWGYYLYPDCYNYQGEMTCSVRNKHLDDRILWLFEESDALFPSAYLKNPLNVTHNKNLVHGMVTEAQRIQRILSKKIANRPIYLYSRFRYMNGEYYNMADLKATIGQAQALRVDGVILWDDHVLSENRTICENIQKYLENKLGPYIKSLELPRGPDL